MQGKEDDGSDEDDDGDDGEDTDEDGDDEDGNWELYLEHLIDRFNLLAWICVKGVSLFQGLLKYEPFSS